MGSLVNERQDSTRKQGPSTNLQGPISFGVGPNGEPCVNQFGDQRVFVDNIIPPTHKSGQVIQNSFGKPHLSTASNPALAILETT